MASERSTVSRWRGAIRGDRVGPATPEPFDPVKDPIATLQEHAEGLSHALSPLPVIDQAKGILMLMYGCDERTAFRLLLKLAHRGDQSVATVGTELVAAAGRLEMTRSRRRKLVRQLDPELDLLQAGS